MSKGIEKRIDDMPTKDWMTKRLVLVVVVCSLVAAAGNGVIWLVV
jgi:hypothetical protein